MLGEPLGDVMPVKQFIEGCKSGEYTDENGYGWFLTRGKWLNHAAIPSKILEGKWWRGYSEMMWIKGK